MLVLEECSFIQVAMKVSVRKYLQRCHLHLTVEQAQREQELKKEEHQPQAAGKLMRQLMIQK